MSKKLKITIAIVVAGMATAIVMQYQANVRLREKIQALQEETLQIPALQQEKERLAKALSDTKKPLAQEQLSELLRLRGEVGALKKQAAAPARIQPGNSRPEKTKSESQDEDSPERTMAIQKLNCAKQLVMAAILFARDNQGAYPADLASAVAAMGNNLDQSIGQWTSSFEIVYQGPIDAITNPANTIVFREKEAFQSNGRWARAYGFADGHSEIHSSADNDYEAWESQRIQKAQPAAPAQ